MFFLKIEIHVEDIKIKAGNISEDDDQEQITKTEESYSTETGCSLGKLKKINNININTCDKW